MMIASAMRKRNDGSSTVTSSRTARAISREKDLAKKEMNHDERKSKKKSLSLYRRRRSARHG
jgi:hypothetical protein